MANVTDIVAELADVRTVLAKPGVRDATKSAMVASVAQKIQNLREFTTKHAS